jgi:alkanesulfonate monooxygenase SsuD/methylene tetrahydromethanopterin reductase-like flavin-dependent oxidoreductase (luciferase family)
VGFTPFETRSDVILTVARRADELGLDFVGIAEGWTYDALILLAELALQTERIQIGSMVISVLGRTPATIALGAAGLQRCSAGRFSLGIGAGSPPLAEGLHGITWDRPAARLRQTLIAVRTLLRGERLPNPVADARPLRLGTLPDAPVPIALAALSPSSIRLAGEHADDWTPFLWARSRIDDGRTLLERGRSSADTPAPTRVCPAIPAALAPDEESSRKLAAWWLWTYATRMGPLYRRMLSERFGMAAALNAVVAAADGNRAPTLPTAAETLAREVTLIGTYDEASEGIASWFRSGADMVHLVLPPGRPEAELVEIVDIAASRFGRRQGVSSTELHNTPRPGARGSHPAAAT